MTYLLALLPVLVCLALMFGAGALGWLATKTGLGRSAPAGARDPGAEA
jgi:hypothetical protein